MHFTYVRDYKSCNLSQNFHRELYLVESHIFVDSCLGKKYVRLALSKNKEYSLIKLYVQYLNTILIEVPTKSPNYKQLIAYMQPSQECLERVFQSFQLLSREHSISYFPLIYSPKHNLLSGRKKNTRNL